jgi:hypothetical protein
LIVNAGSGILDCTILAGNVTFYSWPSLGCPSAIGWQEELVAEVGRLTTAVLRGKGRFAFVGLFPQEVLYSTPINLIILISLQCPK